MRRKLEAFITLPNSHFSSNFEISLNGNLSSFLALRRNFKTLFGFACILSTLFLALQNIGHAPQKIFILYFSNLSYMEHLLRDGGDLDSMDRSLIDYNHTKGLANLPGSPVVSPGSGHAPHSLNGHTSVSSPTLPPPPHLGGQADLLDPSAGLGASISFSPATPLPTPLTSPEGVNVMPVIKRDLVVRFTDKGNSVQCEMASGNGGGTNGTTPNSGMNPLNSSSSSSDRGGGNVAPPPNHQSATNLATSASTGGGGATYTNPQYSSTPKTPTPSPISGVVRGETSGASLKYKEQYEVQHYSRHPHGPTSPCESENSVCNRSRENLISQGKIYAYIMHTLYTVNITPCTICTVYTMIRSCTVYTVRYNWLPIYIPFLFVFLKKRQKYRHWS